MPIGNIRKYAQDNAAALKEGGAAALGTLIMGGSKAEAAMTGLGQTILTHLIGPLGKFAGLAAVATRGILNMTKAWATMGTGAASKLETVQNQLRVMLKGLDAAKQRVRELRNFSIATPFKMGDIVQGNRALESLTRGALSTKAAMTLVGDAAAQAGVNFEDMSVYVGRLYDGLAAGRPVGEVLFRLAELGVVSGQARTAIEQLQESGAGFSEVWRVVEGELKRSAGTMEHTSKTLEGLQSTLEDTQDEIKATFSENFMEGQKEAIQAQITTLENLKPAVVGLGSAYGGVVNVVNTFTAKLMAAATSIPGVATALEFLGRMAGIAAVGITALSVAIGTANLMGKLSALTGAASVAGRVMGFMGVAAKGLATVLMRLVTGPMGMLVAGLAVAAGLWTQHRDRVLAAAAAQREYAGATDALLSKMAEQRASIKTLDSLSAAYQSTLGALATAYREAGSAQAALVAAQARGDNRGIQESGARLRGAWARIEALKKEAALLDVIDRKGLEKDAFHAGNLDAMAGNQRSEAKAAMEAERQKMSPMARAESYQREADELARRRGAAVNENNQIEAFRQSKSGVGDRMRKNLTEQAQAEGAMEANFNGDGDKYQQAAEALKRLKDEERALIQEEINLADANGSEIVKLQARLALLAKYESQAASVRAAEVALREAQNAGDDAGKQKAIEEKTAALEEQRRALEALQKAAQSLNITPAKAQEMRLEIERRKRDLQADLLNRPEESSARAAAEQEKRGRRKGLMESQGDRRVTVAQEEGGALAAARRQLQVERERLELQREYKEIDDEVYRNRRDVLDAEDRMLGKRRGRATLENQAEVNAGRLDLRAKALRMGGRGRQADALEEQGLRQKEDAGLESRVREIMDQTGMDEAGAKRQAGGEVDRARQGRALDREGGILQALLGGGQKVDSLQRIGGGGAAAAGPDLKKVIDRLDKLIRVTENQRPTEMRLS